MKLFYDLHIHSCLSPCASDDMTPANIANMAALAGLQVIAVSDHNSCLNCPAAQEAARSAGLVFVPAMELCTREEVHVLCLLPGLSEALAFSAYVRERLPETPNRPDIYGDQLIMDGGDRILGREDKLLAGAAAIGLYEAAGLLKRCGGIAVPAHIDRPSFSLLSNLGFYDPAMDFCAYEATPGCDMDALLKSQPALSPLRAICNSDAHDLACIPDARNQIEVEKPDARGVIAALYGSVSLSAD